MKTTLVKKLTTLLLSASIVVGSFCVPAAAVATVDTTVEAGTALSTAADTTEAQTEEGSALAQTVEDLVAVSDDVTAETNDFSEDTVENAVLTAILNGEDEVDISDYDVSTKEASEAAEAATADVSATDAVETTVELDEDGNASKIVIVTDPRTEAASDELNEVEQTNPDDPSDLVGLTLAEKQMLLQEYEDLCAFKEQYADIFGVDVPYNTWKDTADDGKNPLASLMALCYIYYDETAYEVEVTNDDGETETQTVAGFYRLNMLGGSAEGNYVTVTLEDGTTQSRAYMDAQSLYVMLKAFNLSNQFGAQYYGEAIAADMQACMAEIQTAAANAGSDGLSEAEMLLIINDYICSHATLDMDYMMSANGLEGKEAAPVDEHYNEIYSTIENSMQEEGYTDEQIEQICPTLVEGVYNMWKTNQIGSLGQGTGLCISYVNAYNYLVQCAHPEIYKTTDEDGNSVWKSYKDVNYVVTEEETGEYEVAKDENDEIIYEEVKKVKTDENGNTVYEQKVDENGKLVYEQKVDENGEPVVDENGNAVYDETKPVYDTSKPVYVQKVDENNQPVYEQKVDENGELVYEQKVDENNEPVFDENGNAVYDETKPVYDETKPVYETEQVAKQVPVYETVYTASTDADYVVDTVDTVINAFATMYGQKQVATSDHYWSVSNIDGTWYYVDTNYVDAYVSSMSQNRDETDGSENHLLFACCEDDVISLFGEEHFVSIDSAYSDLATDDDLEHTWFSRATGRVSVGDDGFYYAYDSTDTFDMLNNSSSMMSMSSDDIEYAICYREFGYSDSDDTMVKLIDFTADDGVTVRNGANGKKTEVNDELTEAYNEMVEMKTKYPSLEISGALYEGKFYFNLANYIFSYDVSDGTVEKVKEYNTVYAERDWTRALGCMGFTVTDNAEDADLTVLDHPIASMDIVDGELHVSIATNHALISSVGWRYFVNVLNYGVEDESQKQYGYSFEETNYNSDYVDLDSYLEEYSQYASMLESYQEDNDNEEFMYSAVLKDYDTDMSELTGDSHDYETVSVPATCGKNAFTEERCATCGAIKADSRVEEEDTALEHHYVTSSETYYRTSDRVYTSTSEDPSTSDWLSGDCYVCAICGDVIQDDDGEAITDVEELPEGTVLDEHVYNNFKWTWAEDHLSATATAECAYCGQKLYDCTATLDTTKTFDATVTTETTGHCDDEDGRVTVYTASIEVDGKTYTDTYNEKGTKSDHTIKDPVFTWSEDGTTATVTFNCAICDYTETVDATVTAAPETAATCENEGYIEYTATASKYDQEYTGTNKVKTADALGHDWGEPTFTWSEDGTTATATYTCARCEKTETEDAVMTSDATAATCTTDGSITYTATSTKDDKTYTDTNTVKTDDALGHTMGEWTTATEPTCTEAGNEQRVCTVCNDYMEVRTVEALGHDWSEPEFTWSEDGKTATATYTCARCNEKEKVDATVTASAETKATCTADGYIEYTATVEKDDKTYTDTNKVTTEAALGHDWGEPVFTWSEDGTTATATYTCARCAETDTENAAMTNVETAATCTDKGSVVYTATVTRDGKNYTDSKTTEIPAKGHTMGEWTTVKAATCTEAGNEQRACTNCDYIEVRTTDALGHSWNEPVFTWSEDGTTATATYTCATCGTTETEDAAITSTTTQATCTENGFTAYVATVTRDGKAYTSTNTIKIPALGHTFGEWTTVTSPNCTDKGSDQRVCSVCGYIDTRDVDALGHEWEEDYTIDKEATYTTDGSKSIHCKNCDAVKDSEVIPAPTSPFEDVTDKEEYYYTPVLWAADNGIVYGVDDTHFAPDATCTRAQVVTFLYRAAGEPEVTGVENPFVDVKEEDYFYDAVLWGFKNGIVYGVDDTHFAPETTVTRAQFITFLYRYAGEPEVTEQTNPFTDLVKDEYYVDAVLWGYQHKIVYGTTETTFEPESGCKRAEVVTFLYRYMNPDAE